MACSAERAPVVVAYSPYEATALFWIARDRQFFSSNGLEVSLRRYDSGAASLVGVLKGEADIAVGLSEFPVVRMAFQKEKMTVVANADHGEFIYLVGRRDRGIEKAADLKGKRVGTAFGTVAQFHLGRFLALNGIKAPDLTLVDLKTPAEWVNAVLDGTVDAVATAQPDANTVKDSLGDDGFIWPVQSDRFVHGLIVATGEWVANHPELVTRFLKAIAQAEEYALRSPAESKAIV
ncbi:MAG: ABC transporter substrate-binding protein [Chloroflexi bacterium]|nr:ABC transporter substrate-binding protein [Chloroflexota bacterium]